MLLPFAENNMFLISLVGFKGNVSPLVFFSGLKQMEGSVSRGTNKTP